MKTSNKLLLGALITLMAVIIGILTSLQINKNTHVIKGNKNRVTSIRNVSSFTQIDASSVTVNIRQSSTPGVKVIADSNVQPLVITEIKDNTLNIYIKGKIVDNEKIQVDVDVPQLNQITGSAGCLINIDSLFNADKLGIDGSSGSIFKLALNAQTITCDLSSGATLNLTGKTNLFSIDSSSGSIINANDFVAEQLKIDSNSGAENNVHVNKSLDIDISSGSTLNYSGNPQINIEDISSGATMKKTNK